MPEIVKGQNEQLMCVRSPTHLCDHVSVCKVAVVQSLEDGNLVVFSCSPSIVTSVAVSNALPLSRTQEICPYSQPKDVQVW